jgi:hypothetical protein
MNLKQSPDSAPRGRGHGRLLGMRVAQRARIKELEQELHAQIRAVAEARAQDMMREALKDAIRTHDRDAASEAFSSRFNDLARTGRSPVENRKSLPAYSQLRKAKWRLAFLELPALLSGWLTLISLIIVDYLIFGLFHVSYFQWFFASGAGVALIAALVAAVVDLDSHASLIAAHPWSFLAEVTRVLVDVNVVMTASMASPRPDEEEEELQDIQYLGFLSYFRWVAFDEFMTKIFSYIFTLVFIVWAVVLAPMLYFIDLICGAPARAFVASSMTVWLLRSDEKDIRSFTWQIGRKDAKPSGTLREIGFSTRPVTTTFVFAAGFIFVAGHVQPWWP